MEPVYLRALELGDLERTHRWHNDPGLYETLVGPFRHVSQAAEEEWLRRKVAYAQQEVNLAICLVVDSRHIGNAYLRSVDWVARHGEVSLFIGEAGERAKGYGTAALHLLVRHAFRDLGLLRLYALILADNRPSLRMCEKCGFAVEGRLRRHAYKAAEFKDLLVVGLLQQDLPTGG
jgi:RimJ/RimL family protein N-acetyltransferase